MFVNQTASMLEQSGLPPVAGRIAAYLLVCDPPHQSSTQLADFVNASAGSVSTATRMLVGIGLVERVRLPGTRSHHFRMKEDCWSELIHAETMRVRRMREIADQGVAMMEPLGPERSRRVREFRDFQAFMEREFPVLVAHWDARKEKP